MIAERRLASHQCAPHELCATRKRSRNLLGAAWKVAVLDVRKWQRESANYRIEVADGFPRGCNAPPESTNVEFAKEEAFVNPPSAADCSNNGNIAGPAKDATPDVSCDILAPEKSFTHNKPATASKSSGLRNFVESQRGTVKVPGECSSQSKCMATQQRLQYEQKFLEYERRAFGRYKSPSQSSSTLRQQNLEYYITRDQRFPVRKDSDASQSILQTDVYEPLATGCVVKRAEKPRAEAKNADTRPPFSVSDDIDRFHRTTTGLRMRRNQKDPFEEVRNADRTLNLAWKKMNMEQEKQAAAKRVQRGRTLKRQRPPSRIEKGRGTTDDQLGLSLPTVSADDATLKSFDQASSNETSSAALHCPSELAPQEVIVVNADKLSSLTDEEFSSRQLDANMDGEEMDGQRLATSSQVEAQESSTTLAASSVAQPFPTLGDESVQQSSKQVPAVSPPLTAAEDLPVEKPLETLRCASQQHLTAQDPALRQPPELRKCDLPPSDMHRDFGCQNEDNSPLWRLTSNPSDSHTHFKVLSSKSADLPSRNVPCLLQLEVGGTSGMVQAPLLVSEEADSQIKKSQIECPSQITNAVQMQSSLAPPGPVAAGGSREENTGLSGICKELALFREVVAEAVRLAQSTARRVSRERSPVRKTFAHRKLSRSPRRVSIRDATPHLDKAIQVTEHSDRPEFEVKHGSIIGDDDADRDARAAHQHGDVVVQVTGNGPRVHDLHRSTLNTGSASESASGHVADCSAVSEIARHDTSAKIAKESQGTASKDAAAAAASAIAASAAPATAADTAIVPATTAAAPSAAAATPVTAAAATSGAAAASNLFEGGSYVRHESSVETRRLMLDEEPDLTDALHAATVEPPIIHCASHHDGRNLNLDAIFPSSQKPMGIPKLMVCFADDVLEDMISQCAVEVGTALDEFVERLMDAEFLPASAAARTFHVSSRGTTSADAICTIFWLSATFADLGFDKLGSPFTHTL